MTIKLYKSHTNAIVIQDIEGGGGLQSYLVLVHSLLMELGWWKCNFLKVYIALSQYLRKFIVLYVTMSSLFKVRINSKLSWINQMLCYESVNKMEAIEVLELEWIRRRIPLNHYTSDYSTAGIQSFIYN